VGSHTLVIGDHRALRKHRDKAAHADLSPFLQHPLKVIFFQQALVHRDQRLGFARRRALFDHFAPRLFFAKLDQFDLVFPTLVIKHDEPCAGAHPQHDTNLVRYRVFEQHRRAVQPVGRDKKTLHGLVRVSEPFR
jgi:hypothetical protein